MEGDSGSLVVDSQATEDEDEDQNFGDGQAARMQAERSASQFAEGQAFPGSGPARSHGAQSGVTGHFSLAPATMNYYDLPEKTREFDGLMYNVLKLNITGPAAALLEHTAIPSYVQAIIVLTKHYNLSRLQRVQGAFEAIDKLRYTGDPMGFQLAFMAAKREMDMAKVTIMDFYFCRLISALLYRLSQGSHDAPPHEHRPPSHRGGSLPEP